MSGLWRWLLLVAPVLVANQAAAQSLLEGTLFTSPEQRAYLDYLRQDFLTKSQDAGFDITETQIPDIPVDGPDGPTGPVEYTLGGIMNRGGGRITIWLNNQSLTEDQLPANARLVRTGNTLALQFTTAAGTQLLRPGQTIEVGTGAVQERYQREAAQMAEEAPAETDDPEDTTPADEDAAEATAVADDSAEEATPTEGETPDSAEAADPTSVVESLSADIREDPSALEAMIKTLQTLRDGLDADPDR